MKWNKFNVCPAIGSKIFLMDRHNKGIYPTSYRLEGYDVMKHPNKDEIYLACFDDRGEGTESISYQELQDGYWFYWWIYAEDLRDIIEVSYE